MTEFLAYDGEAVKGEYTMLMNRLDVQAADGWLSTEQALRFLDHDDYAGHEGAVRVFFGMGYDVDMILRDWPDEDLRFLYAAGTRKVGEWTVTYYPRRILIIQRGDGPKRTYYDVWSWFGTSLIAACEQWGIPVPAIVHRGKRDRAHFRRWSISQIVAYCLVECNLVEQLMGKVADMVSTAGWGRPLKAWYGPGALANRVFSEHKLRTKLYGFRAAEDDQDMVEAFDRAYFGGRIELLKLGGFPDGVWRYDLHSAYPFAMAMLPVCTRTWFRTRRYLGAACPFALYRVAWRLPHATSREAGPFPWRADNGQIYYPAEGEGWYWYPEVSSALERYGNKHVKVLDGYWAMSRPWSPLHTVIPSLYEHRQALERAGDPAAYLVKVTLAALYGKVAQRVGAAPFHCMPWAGYITSRVRAELLAAAYQDRDAVIGFATDAVFATRKLPLEVGSGLGQWSETHFDYATFVEPGVHILGNQGTRPTLATRGFPQDAKNADWLIQELNSHGTYRVVLHLFVGHDLALRFPDHYGPWRLRWRDEERFIQPYYLDKRRYDVHARPGAVAGTRPIKDWRTEHRDSFILPGLGGLSRRPRDDSELTDLDRLEGAAVIDAETA